MSLPCSNKLRLPAECGTRERQLLFDTAFVLPQEFRCNPNVVDRRIAAAQPARQAIRVIAICCCVNVCAPFERVCHVQQANRNCLRGFLTLRRGDLIKSGARVLP